MHHMVRRHCPAGHANVGHRLEEGIGNRIGALGLGLNARNVGNTAQIGRRAVADQHLAIEALPHAERETAVDIAIHHRDVFELLIRHRQTVADLRDRSWRSVNTNALSA
jgi:hypothetical protein